MGTGTTPAGHSNSSRVLWPENDTPRADRCGRQELVITLLATPAAAGLMWHVTYLYGDLFKEWESDGWGLAPLGTAFVVLCATVLALQLVLLLRALPDTRAGRWVEAILTTGFALALALEVFGYLGLFTVGDVPDGFPDQPGCIVGLWVGGLVSVAVPTAIVAWRARGHPPVGVPLQGRARVRLVLVVTATVLLVVLPTVANATANPELLWGLVLVPAFDLMSRAPSLTST
jgi:hypothetical protein